MTGTNAFACALALAGLLGGAIASAPGLALAQAGDATLSLAVGAHAVIDLDENPSTGYTWHFDPQRSKNAAIVSVADLGFSPPPAQPSPIGAPGRRRWSVEAVRTGRAELVFTYARPWEDRPAREHRAEVEVR